VFEKIVKELMNMLVQLETVEENTEGNHFENAMEAKWVIAFYKAFESTYSPERRRVMFKVCYIPKIKQKLNNSIGFLKLVESENVKESELLKELRGMSVATIKSKKEQQDEDKKEMADKLVELQLQKIKLLIMADGKNPPFLKFTRLTQSSHKRVLTLLFSGFMSQDTCKVSEWGGILETLYDS
jgi:hypothetical protein